MRAKKMPLRGESKKHRTESGRAFRVVQIYGKFRTYTTIKNNIRGVQL